MQQTMMMTAPEVANTLGIAKNKVYRMIQRKELPSLMIGSSIRIPQEALYQWIRSNTTGTGGDEKEEKQR